MQSNPIQQRIELICEKWEEAKKYTAARIVLMRCQPDETDMVDTFYTYMIGVDTPILDIAFHFDSVCNDQKEFSNSLLLELEEIMDIWNNSEKDSRIDYVPIHWQPDRTLEKDKNPAAMFVHNFNALAKEMALPEELFTVAIFKASSSGKDIIPWLKAATEASISPAVKFLIHDTIAKPFYDDLVLASGPALTTIPLNLNMPKAMEQVAAMGDPNDPATGYRVAFMKMMNEMSAGNENKAEESGHECIKIATQHIGKDPYWITQVIVIYIALANDKIRYKNKEATLDYANKAVETATASKAYFEDNISSQLFAQAIMFRGSVLFIHEKSREAYTDFSAAFELYSSQGNTPLAIEACRMAGESAIKSGQKENASKLLTAGTRLGYKMNAETAAATTYAGILDLLLQTNYIAFISLDELDKIARPIYGPDWITTVKDWKKIPDYSSLKKKEMEAAEN